MIFIKELKLLIDNEFYNSALIIASIVPDVCSGISSSTGKTNNILYKNWAKKYFIKYYPDFFSEDELYRLRCSLLHQGKTSHEGSKYSGLRFVLPSNIKLYNIKQINKTTRKEYFVTDIREFCLNMILAYEEWRKESMDTPNYKRNIQNIINIYSSTLGIFSGGITIMS